jgi:hypothetical protein
VLLRRCEETAPGPVRRLHISDGRINGLRWLCGRRRDSLFRPCLRSRAALPDPSPRNRASNRHSWLLPCVFSFLMAPEQRQEKATVHNLD